MELRRTYAELIRRIIRLRSVEYLVIANGYQYREELRCKIREASRDADRVQARLIEEMHAHGPSEQGTHSDVSARGFAQQ